jgi:hypothetical protein
MSKDPFSCSLDGRFGNCSKKGIGNTCQRLCVIGIIIKLGFEACRILPQEYKTKWIMGVRSVEKELKLARDSCSSSLHSYIMM